MDSVSQYPFRYPRTLRSGVGFRILVQSYAFPKRAFRSSALASAARRAEITLAINALVFGCELFLCAFDLLSYLGDASGLQVRLVFKSMFTLVPYLQSIAVLAPLLTAS